MTTEEDLTAMQAEIAELELQLADMRREFREKRTAALKAAIDARNEADKLVREEMARLGYKAPVRHSWFV